MSEARPRAVAISSTVRSARVRGAGLLGLPWAAGRSGASVSPAGAGGTLNRAFWQLLHSSGTGHRVPGTKYRTLRTRIVGALSFSLVAGAAIGADLQLAQERHQRATEGESGHAEEGLEGQEGGGEGGRAEDE
ncbi:hypothetical protein ACFXEL_37845 [Streptomyces sp. NPDC059382]|uniref:hypothetical protein n=1 Tax=Streptomyces sp. NPDC059382 TaxID=3346816 RepID=UPI0036A45966